MSLTVFTQGVSSIVAPLFASRYKVSAVVESAPRGWLPGNVRSDKLERICRGKGVPYFWLAKSTANGLIDFLCSLKEPLDLGVVYSMSQLLPEEVLRLFPRGVINAHPSLLPAYRGPNPYFWVFFDRCAVTGVTIHYLDKGEDTGDIIIQQEIQIEELDSNKLHQVVSGMLPNLLLKAISLVMEGIAKRHPQPKDSPTRRAMNITTKNVCEVLASLTLSLEQYGDFFSKTSAMLPLRLMEFRLHYPWRMDRYVLRDLHLREYPPDVIRLTRWGLALPRPDGWLVIRPQKDILLKLCRKVSRMLVPSWKMSDDSTN